MNILINAISISEGGALVILKCLLKEMVKADPSIKWYVVVKPQLLTELSDSEAVILLSYSWANFSFLHQFCWYQFVLPRLLIKVKADLCFSQTNFLPNKNLPCKTLLLIHNAGLFSELFQQLYLNHNKAWLSKLIWAQKNKQVLRSLQRASKVVVQTDSLADLIAVQAKIDSQRIITIPHGPGLLNQSAGRERIYPCPLVWRIGYITKFGVQKDFHSAFEALAILKSQGVQLKLILTLDPNESSPALILRQARQYGIEELIENHGEVSDPSDLHSLYESLHLFIFPSLCESFGFTLIEAMSMGLPVIASNIPTNIELMSNAGYFFKAGDSRNLFERINTLISDPKLYEENSRLCLERSSQFSWSKAAKDTLKVLNELR